MIESMQSEKVDNPATGFGLVSRPPLLQRKCACGAPSGLSGPCDSCQDKRLAVQRYASDRISLDSALMTVAQPLLPSARSLVGGDRFRVDAIPDLIKTQETTQVRTKSAISEAGDPFEQEADRAAAIITGSSINQAVDAPAPGQTAAPIIQRVAAEPSPASTAPVPSDSAEAQPMGLIVEDDTAEVQPHQMRKSDFLAQLSSELYSTAEPILATRGRTAANCPYLVNWIDYGYMRSGRYVEAFVRRFGGGATTVASAQEYFPLMKERLRQSLLIWAESGRITGVPLDLASDVVATKQMSEVQRLGGQVQSESTPGSSSAAGAVQAKAADGLSSPSSDPEAVQNQLSAGTPLESNTRQRMESAFGYNFSRVRVHDDAKAASLATRLNARAFTVGHDVAFAAGEYSPGSLVGDALLAHELAHVVQQGGATTDLAALGISSPSASLETDADRSAVGAVVSLWGQGKARFADLRNNSFPRLRSGLRLSRCESCSCNSAPRDAAPDAPRDAGRDAGPDAGRDAGPDAQTPDAGPPPTACNLTPTTDDQAVLDRINRLGQSERLRFLTGRMDPSTAVFGEIQTSINSRVNTKVSALNNIRPAELTTIRPMSRYRGFLQNPPGSTSQPQAQIVFEKFFLVGSRSGGWDSLPRAYRNPNGTVNRDRWLREATLTRLQHILRFSAVPGASRHHWHTDVDFNSTTSADWEGTGTLATLGTWLSRNACREGFVQAYTAGRSGGHALEQWHYSYAPIAIGIRQLYGTQVLPSAPLESEVIAPLIAEFSRRAAEAGVTMPPDFETGLRQLNIAEYVNTIEPSL